MLREINISLEHCFDAYLVNGFSDSSGSDSDDPDKEVNSALFLPVCLLRGIMIVVDKLLFLTVSFLQKKSVDEEAATAKKRPAEEPATPPNDAKKPKLNEKFAFFIYSHFIANGYFLQTDTGTLY